MNAYKCNENKTLQTSIILLGRQAHKPQGIKGTDFLLGLIFISRVLHNC